MSNFSSQRIIINYYKLKLIVYGQDLQSSINRFILSFLQPISILSIIINSNKNIKIPYLMSKQFHSIIHDQRFYKIRYPYSSNEAKKYPTHKLKNQQIFQKRHLHQNHNAKIAIQLPTTEYDVISEVSKSETFINQHQPRLSLSRMEREKITLKKINKHFQQEQSQSNQMSTKKDIEFKCESAANFITQAKNNAYKTQYSKLTRRKETIIRRPFMLEQNQKIGQVSPPNQSNLQSQFYCQSQLIQKYRQLMNKQSGPFNLINKLYQNELLTTKLMPLLNKQKLLITKLNKNDEDIQQKINKIVSKPTQYDTIRKMLLNINDKIDQVSIHPHTNPKTAQHQAIQYRYIRHFDPINSIKKQSLFKSQQSPAIKSPALPNQRYKKEQSHSVAKIESQSHINPSKQIYPPPTKIISAAFIIYQPISHLHQKGIKKMSIQFSKKRQYQNNIHIGNNIKLASEIASLTKIMTCILIIEICQKYGINTKLEKYRTGIFEANIYGTSAQIEPGQIYTIHELLHGLMLPSGNDASLALAKWGGNILLLHDFQSTKRGFSKIQSTKGEEYQWATNNKFIKNQSQKLKAKRCYNRFIAEMNKKARLLGMQRTTYVNSHGLSNILNRSCCLDLALLCQHTMRNSYFREIVSCKQFSTKIDKQIIVTQQPKKRSKKKLFNYDPEEMNLEADAEDQQTEDKSDDEVDEPQVKKVQYTKKHIHWVNTHKLLHQRKEYVGIKTGVTNTAGPCLASFVVYKQRKFIIIVLNSKKLSQRFIDTQILKNWLVKKEKLMIESKIIRPLIQANTQRLQQDKE